MSKKILNIFKIIVNAVALIFFTIGLCTVTIFVLKYFGIPKEVIAIMAIIEINIIIAVVTTTTIYNKLFIMDDNETN